MCRLFQLPFIPRSILNEFLSWSINVLNMFNALPMLMFKSGLFRLLPPVTVSLPVPPIRILNLGNKLVMITLNMLNKLPNLFSQPTPEIKSIDHSILFNFRSFYSICDLPKSILMLLINKFNFPTKSDKMLRLSVSPEVLNLVMMLMMESKIGLDVGNFGSQPTPRICKIIKN